MTTPNLQELLDELAGHLGWKYENVGGLFPHHWWRGTERFADALEIVTAHHTRYASDHPVPATLDAVAAAMPEGAHGLEIEFTGAIWYASTMMNNGDQIEADAPTELEARAELACKCWRALKSNKQGGAE